jgi:small conductance mechanosensitive channel
MLYTRLLTPDNKVVVIPNGTLSNGNIVNVGKQPTRRLDIQIGISYGADLKLAKKTLKEILEKNAYVLQDRDIQVLVASLDESCVTLETRSWVNSSDYWPARFELLELYKLTFDEKGIEIPFNQMDVHIVQ